jgi:hypothetical protein
MAIANILKNRSPRRALNYLLHPSKQARILGGQVFGTLVDGSIGEAIVDRQTSSRAVAELSQLFQAHSYLNGYAVGSVKHISLGFSRQDGRVSDEDKMAVATRLMKDLGFEDTLWVAIDHHRCDPKHKRRHHHDHIHIVCHSLDWRGCYIADGFDYPLAEQSLRQSEVDLGLTNLMALEVELEPSDEVEVGVSSERSPCYYPPSRHDLSPVVALKRSISFELSPEQDLIFELS